MLILYLVLLLLLRCRKSNETWAKLKPQRYAHRGYHDKPTIPENSMPAFRRAIEHGWGAELDVHLLRDGTLAVFHDSDLKRCANVEGQIEDLDLEGLRKLRLEGTDEQVPLFDDVLALFEGKQPLIIELKTAKGNHRALAEAVCKRLDSYKGDFCIESFDPFAVADVRKLRPGICRGQLSMNFLKEPSGLPWYQRFLMTNVLLNWYTRPDWFAGGQGRPPLHGASQNRRNRGTARQWIAIAGRPAWGRSLRRDGSVTLRPSEQSSSGSPRPLRAWPRPSAQAVRRCGRRSARLPRPSALRRRPRC